MDPSDSPSGPLAGPSSPPPAVFPAPQPPPNPKQHLHSTQDLLAVFNLLPAYDKYVRPHVRPIGEPDSVKGKGKGKEREVPAGDVAPPDRDADDEEGGEKKKKKDSYRHLIKRTPGKHSMKKDSYFQTLMAVPPKQKMQIQPVDAKTLREGFSVSLTGLPAYNRAALEGTDPKEKEAKRLKKERRKAEKEERLRIQQQQQAHGSGSNPSTPAAASTPRAVATPGSSVSQIRGTPAPKGKSQAVARSSGTPRPGTPKVPQQRTASTPAQPVTLGRVASQPITAGGRPTLVNGTAATGSAGVTETRGVKRELDVQPLTPGQSQDGANGQSRPPKKRRLGSSTPQPTPLQQPTPHGS